EHRLAPGGGDETLRREVVDLVRLRVAHDRRQGVLIEQVRGHDVHPVQQVADPLVGVVGGAAHHADHLVPLVEQQFGEIGPILPGDAGDDRCAAAGLSLLLHGLSFGRLYPALAGGVRLRGVHPAVGRPPWRECVRSVARAPRWGTASATQTTSRTGAGTPTSSGSGRWWTARSGACASAPAVSSPTASPKRPNEKGDFASPPFVAPPRLSVRRPLSGPSPTRRLHSLRSSMRATSAPSPARWPSFTIRV